MFAIVLMALVLAAVVAAVYYTHAAGARAHVMMREAVRAQQHAEKVTVEIAEHALQSQQRCADRVREIQAEKHQLEEDARALYDRVLAVRSRADAAAGALDAVPKVRQSLPHATMLPVTPGFARGAFVDRLVLRPDGRLWFYAARPWTDGAEPFVVGQALRPDQCDGACAEKIASVAPKQYASMVWSRADLAPCRGGECPRIFAHAGFREMCGDLPKCQVGFILVDGVIPESLRASIAAAYSSFRTELYAKLFDGVDLARADLETLLLQNLHPEDRAYLRSLHVFLEEQTPVSVHVGGSTHEISLTKTEVPFHAAVLAVVMRYLRYRMQPPIMQLSA